MARLDTLVRVLSLIKLLRTQRMDLAQIAQEFHVTSRTVRRDLQALNAAHLHVSKHGPYYSIRDLR